MKVNYEHIQAAHCENGAASGLMNFHGLKVSEPMIFGIGSGLFFSHIPFVKLNGIPASSYRVWPGNIFKRFTKRLNIKMKKERFSNPAKAMKALDDQLAKGLPVGCLTSVFYLTYLPEAFRFHFNAHNIVVFGKEGDEYLVSDPVMDKTTRIKKEDLIRARFAKGVPNTRGRMYYPIDVPELKDEDFIKAIVKGIKYTSYDMSEIPASIFGSKGIRTVAKKVKSWPEKLGKRKAILFLGHLVRMQEEIGTGGGGFRFIYAAFLKESAKYKGLEWLAPYGDEMTKIGDRWRDFAFTAGRICKGREANNESFSACSEILMDCYKMELDFFTRLRTDIKKF